jgi:hypothetical protein
MRNFRSVNGTWELPFLKGGQPASLLILGENGTGKSTVSDALEFALQGSTRNLTWRNIYASPAEESWCEVIFESPGVPAVRTNKSGERHQVDQPADVRFAYSNFVIKRREIERFSSLPDNGRSELLAGFMRLSEVLQLEENQERQKLVEELASAKATRSEALTEFANLEGLADADVPKSQARFDAYVLQRRGGSPGLNRGQRRNLPPLPEDLGKIVKTIRSFDGKTAQLHRQLYDLNRQIRADRLARELSAVSQDVTSGFLQLVPSRQGIRKIVFEVGSGESPSIDISVEFENNVKTSPFKILNEASLDLLALLTFASLVKAATRHGQEKLLILDDVFSSADSALRMKFAAYLFKEYSDWQVVAIFHDRLWFEQFRRAANNAKHMAIFLEFGRRIATGSPLAYQAPSDASIRVREKLSDPAADTKDLASASGLLIETLFEHLSVSLRVKVERKLDEGYTISELWPGIETILKGSAAEPAAQRLQSAIHLRNLVGAHFMIWSQNISHDECEELAEAAVGLWDQTFCHNCNSFVARSGRALKCSCGTLTF